MSDQDKTCRQCGRVMESIFGTGRSLWCPKCERHGNKESKKDSKVVASSEKDDPFGFHIIELED